MKNERQILTCWTRNQHAVTHMQSSNHISLLIDTPETVMWWMRKSQDAYVKIAPSYRTVDVAFDVYLVDRNYNTVWCESDAINPMGYGRIFHCGEDIYKIIVVCRRRKWWHFRLREVAIDVAIGEQPWPLWTEETFKEF